MSSVANSTDYVSVSDVVEWYFRSSLDRYVWIFGMLCAWAHPHANAALERIDGMQLKSRLAARAAITAATLVLGGVWYTAVFTQPKLTYNQLHPYTSWVPILCWIVVRLCCPHMLASRGDPCLPCHLPCADQADQRQRIVSIRVVLVTFVCFRVPRLLALCGRALDVSRSRPPACSCSHTRSLHNFMYLFAEQLRLLQR